MKQVLRIAVCTLSLVVLVGCGKGDQAAEANKNLKPVDPSAPKPSSAAAAGGGGAAPAKKNDNPAANAAPIM